MPSRRRLLLALGAFAVVAVAAALAVLAGIGVLAPPTTVRSTYALVGAVVALAGYALTGSSPAERTPRVPGTVAAKLAVLAGALAVLATVETGSRVLPLAVFLVVGYALVADQLAARDPAPGPTLVSLATLFAVPAYAKYLTTGFYFGGTDTFAHVDALNRLLAAGHTVAIPYGYDLFPVFHVFVGSVAVFGGLKPYDAVVLTGIAAYTALVPVVYLVGKRLFGDVRVALSVAAAFTLLDLVAHYAVYFFPQSFTLALLLVGFYAVLAARASRSAGRVRAHAVYAVVLVGTLVLTHHLTYVLLGGVLCGVAGVAVLRGALAGRLGLDALATPTFGWARLRWTFPIVLGCLAVGAYLVFSPSYIIYAIVGLGTQLFTDTVTAAVGTTFTYGVTLPTDSVARAVAWLTTPVGVYYSVFAGVVLLGVYELLDGADRYARGATVAAAGCLLAPVLLPLPVSLPQVERLQFIVALLAVFPVGLGVARLLRADPRYRRFLLVAVVLLAALGTAGSFTRSTADDLSGPPVYIPQRDVQTSMTASEYAGVADTAGFLASAAVPTNGSRAASDVITRRAFASVPRYGGGVGAVNATASGVTAPPGYVVTREAWDRTFVPTAKSDVAVSARVQWYTVSEARYRDALASHDVVYRAGSVAVLQQRSSYTLFGSGTTPASGGPGR